MHNKYRIFIKNAAILTATSLLLRTVGMFFRIYLSGKIGAEGMGLYQLIVSVYVLGATFATSGICTAVTRMTADELVKGTCRSVRSVLRRAVLLSVIIGTLSTAVIYLGAEFISVYWIKDIRATPALKILSFSLPSMGVSSCLRGYFIARRRIGSNSRAQLLEQAVRIALIVLIIDRFAIFGLSTACFAVLLADTVAEWTSCGYLALGYALDRHRIKKELKERSETAPSPVLRRLLNIAAPITAGRYLNTTLRTVENILVPNSIAVYIGSREIGLSQFGALKGMALPLIFFPASFLSAVSTLLMPEISSANTLHRKDAVNRAVCKTLRITLACSILIGTVFLVFSRELGELIYGSRDVAVFLRVLAPLTPIMYLESMVDGLLKGLNQQASSLRYSVADSSLRILLILLIVPKYGMGGFLFIMVISNLMTSFLNLNRLLKVTALHVPWERWVLRPVFGAVIASVSALFIVNIPIFDHTSGIIKTILGILCLCGGYIASLFITGSVTRSELGLKKIKNF